jgi:hypothetical protein
MEIHDEFLDKKLFESIKQYLYSPDFSWYYNEFDTPENEKSDGFFTHNFINDGIVGDQNYFTAIGPIFQKLNCRFPLQARANLNTRNGKMESNFHVDQPNTKNLNYKIALLYFTTCNAQTLIKTSDGLKKVDSKENRAVVFSGNLLHRTIYQTDSKIRIILNLNYIEN